MDMLLSMILHFFHLVHVNKCSNAAQICCLQ